MHGADVTLAPFVVASMQPTRLPVRKICHGSESSLLAKGTKAPAPLGKVLVLLQHGDDRLVGRVHDLRKRTREATLLWSRLLCANPVAHIWSVTPLLRFRWPLQYFPHSPQLPSFRCREIVHLLFRHFRHAYAKFEPGRRSLWPRRRERGASGYLEAYFR